MSKDEREALVRRIFAEGLNRGELAVVDEAFAPQFVDRSAPEQALGPEGVKEYMRAVRVGFPDLRVTIERLDVRGDLVELRERWHGTHLGTYEGIAPTGRVIERILTRTFRFAGEKIVEEWSGGPDLLAEP
jgi:predicted ester cyclase